MSLGRRLLNLWRGRAFRRFFNVWRGSAVDREFDDELQFHLEMRVEKNLRRGMDRRDAEAEARRHLGGTLRIKESMRETHVMVWPDHLRQDVLYAFRAFRRSPGSSMAAVVTLALGIGATTAVFSVVNTVLLKPIPYADPDRLVVFATTFLDSGPSYPTSDQKFNVWRQQATGVQDVSGFRYGVTNLTRSDAPEQAQTAWVTADYFRLFGLPLARGRTFTADETRPNGRQVAVLSDGFWRRAFAGDPALIGKMISLSDNSYEVVGIVAPGVEVVAPQPLDVWLPLAIAPGSTSQVHYFTTQGRLAPGVTLDTVNAQLRVAADGFRRDFPKALAMGPRASFNVQPVHDALVSSIRPSLRVLLGAVTFVLLISCANVASLLLVRAAGRTREIAIRAALGAGRGRIVRQLLTESALLAVSGGIAGLTLGMVGIRALLALNPGNIPLIGENGSAVVVDGRVLLFTALVSMATGLVFGTLPAFLASRGDLATTLKTGRAGVGAGAGVNKAGAVLVVGEMALALVLLTGAALLIRTFVALRSVDPGVDADNVLTLRTSLSGPRFEKTAAVDQLVREGIRRLETLPGVVAAAYSSSLPLEGGAVFPYIVEGRPLDGPSHGFGPWASVSPGYFDVFKIPLLRGRLFTNADGIDAARVVVINKAMARRAWTAGDPLNDQIFIGKGSGPEFEEPARQIIGIVGNVHDGPLDRAPQPTMYVPAAQLTDGLNARIVRGSVAWVVRTAIEPHSLAAAIQHELRQASGGVPVGRIRSMEEITAQSTARSDFNLALLTAFGLSALVLAAIGVYGLFAYSVQVRTPEIGIRLALGADRGVVRNMVVLQAVRLAAAGVAIGLACSFGLTRFISGFLFGVTPLDPVVFLAVPVILSAVALLAAWLPARRASRIDPCEALRAD